tara:strand:- start:18 stop:509 length:492 start_codon:yes stop_codon:yes gene_type:complete
MKKTLNPSTLVVLLFVFLYSCSSSDDDSNINDNTNIDNSNFLEKFDGYGYFNDNDINNKEFWFFKNIPNGNYLSYVSTSENITEDCIKISPNFNNEDIVSVELVTNNTLSLLIQINFIGGVQNTVEFNVDDSGNTLTVTENDGEGNNVSIYSKTSTTISSLCN